jgi:hypothetical protein
MNRYVLVMLILFLFSCKDNYNDAIILFDHLVVGMYQANKGYSTSIY